MESKDSSTSMASCKPSRSKSAIPNIKDRPVHNTSAKNGEGSDSRVPFKDDRPKENILNFKNSRRTKESRWSCESGVSSKSDWSSDFISDYKDRSPLKAISQVCSPARSRRPIPNIQVRSSQRGLVEDLLSPGISCASAKRDNSEGCFANVKETFPSPKKKSDFCNSEEEEEDTVADDKDLVKSSEDQMAKESLESIDSGVYLQSDWSKSGLTDFKDSSSLRSELFSYKINKPVGDDEDSVKSPCSGISVSSSLSFKSDKSKDFIENFKDRPFPSSQELSTSELEDNDDDEESVKSSDDEQNKTVLERGD